MKGPFLTLLSPQLAAKGKYKFRINKLIHINHELQVHRWLHVGSIFSRAKFCQKGYVNMASGGTGNISVHFCYTKCVLSIYTKLITVIRRKLPQST